MPKKPKPKKKPGTRLTIAVHGDGVGLKDVGLRQLAQLLEATASVFEAVAQEKQLEPPKLSLARAKHGSAAYDLVSDDPQAERVRKSFVSTIRKRGKGSSPRTRTSLLRLYSVATKTPGAGLRIDPGGEPSDKPIYLASPVEESGGVVEEGTVVYARVVGLKLDFHDHASIVLRYDDGGSGEFEAAPDVLADAARLLGRHVRARVTFQRGERDFEGEVEELSERPQPTNLLEAASEARKALLAAGVVFDSTAWFAEAEEEHRE